MPSLVPGLKRIFDEGFVIAGHGTITGQTYESNVPYVLRYVQKEIHYYLNVYLSLIPALILLSTNVLFKVHDR